jgi:hypothetical protein
MDFSTVVHTCFANKEFVKEYDRLMGANLSRAGSPLDIQIDRVTGRHEKELASFIRFVHTCVWGRLGAAEVSPRPLEV